MRTQANRFGFLAGIDQLQGGFGVGLRRSGNFEKAHALRHVVAGAMRVQPILKLRRGGIGHRHIAEDQETHLLRESLADHLGALVEAWCERLTERDLVQHPGVEERLQFLRTWRVSAVLREGVDDLLLDLRRQRDDALWRYRRRDHRVQTEDKRTQHEEVQKWLAQGAMKES